MKYRIVELLFALVCIVTLVLSFVSTDTNTSDSSFQIGDKLPTAAPASGKTTVGQYRELNWDDLIPKSWDPEKELGDINWDNLDDADPRARQALDRLRAVWDSAPAEPGLEGAKVRLAGFIVPLEYKGDEIREFLLVPYFGACIHTPPPPANQIVHVIASKLPANVQPMDPFWVNGTMALDHSLTDMGFSSYRLIADTIEPFDAASQSGDKAGKDAKPAG